MILWKNPQKKLACILGRVESISPGTGKAEGRKHVVRLSEWNSSGQVRTERIDFWNEPEPYKNPDKPRLMSDWASDLTLGEWVAVVADVSERDHTATAFLHTSGAIDLGDLSIILGIPSRAGTPGLKGGWEVAIPTEGYTETIRNVWFCGKKQEKDAELACLLSPKEKLPVAVLARRLYQKSEGIAQYAGLKILPAKPPEQFETN